VTLNVFTITDRRNIQHYLNLPLQEIKEGSRLWRRLVEIEQLDTDEGTTIATDIQTRLGLIVSLDPVNGANSTLGTAIQSASSQAKRVNVFRRIQIDYQDTKPGQKYSGKAGSIEAYVKKLVADLKRDLGFAQQIGGNTIRTVYPSGHDPVTPQNSLIVNRR
jgi:hypothetical protein